MSREYKPSNRAMRKRLAGNERVKTLVLQRVRSYQEPVLHSTARDDLTVSAPQLGKTFMGMLWLLASAWRGGRSIRPWWVMSPTYMQCRHAMRMFTQMAQSAGVLESATQTPPLSARLINGALIEGRSWERPEGMYGPTIRGGVVDEFGQLTPWAYSAISSRRAESISYGEGMIRYLGNVGEIGGTAEAMWDQAVRGEPGYACRRWSWLDRANAHPCSCSEVGIPPAMSTAGLHARDCVRGVYCQFIVRESRRMSGPQFRQLYGAEWADWNLLPVYGFDREEHESGSVAFDPRLPLEVSCDFNVDPMAWVLGQHQGAEAWVFDEIAISGGATTVAACKELMRRYPSRAIDLVVYGDASGESRKTSAYETDYQTIRRMLGSFYRSLSLKVPRRNPAIVNRVNAFNAKLRAADGTVTWHCHPRCVGLTKDLARVSYKAGTRDIDTSKRKLTHFSDAEGYRMVSLYPVTMGYMRSSSSRLSLGIYGGDEIMGAVF